MRKNLAYSSAVLTIMILISAVIVMADAGIVPKNHKIIRLVQRPGYFVTEDHVFNIKPGDYEFLVENQSRKDAGFILSKGNQKLTEVFIKKGNAARVQVKLDRGNYTYHCPLIPTASYPIHVR